MGYLPVRCWLICISGFLQDEGDPSGIMRLWRRLENEIHNGGRHTRPSTVVVPKTWQCDVDALSDLVFRLRPNAGGPIVRIAGYSWGGATAANLCRSLQRKGVGVDKLILCDPVYRGWRAWRAFCPWARIHIPENVATVWRFYQRTNLPRGHRLVAADNTTVHEQELGRVTHQYADDSPVFFDCAYKEMLEQ